jgi:hypothetical protein
VVCKSPIDSSSVSGVSLHRFPDAMGPARDLSSAQRHLRARPNVF